MRRLRCTAAGRVVGACDDNSTGGKARNAFAKPMAGDGGGAAVAAGASSAGPAGATAAAERRRAAVARRAAQHGRQSFPGPGRARRHHARTGGGDGEERAGEGAVRVPYVPEIVKDQIRKDVEAELAPSIKQEVTDQVGAKGALFSALPDWLRRIHWTGDVRVRGEGDLFARDNVTDVYLNYNEINLDGGIEKAGLAALLNTTRDQERLRLRARFGFDADLDSGWSASLRLATGSTGEIIATTNQTLGTYGAGYTATIDQGYLRWTGQTSDAGQVFTAYAGRFASPWLSTDLVWYNY